MSLITDLSCTWIVDVLVEIKITAFCVIAIDVVVICVVARVTGVSCVVVKQWWHQDTFLS